MQRVNIFPFYQVGARLSVLLSIDEDQTVKEWQNKLYSAQTWLEYILDNQGIPLDVSRPAARNLLAAIKAILEPKPEQGPLYLSALGGVPPPPAEERKLTWMEAYNVRTYLRTFETVLGADLESLSTYFASRKLGYDTRVLIEDASSLLPSGLQPMMPEETIQEYKQLGKCVAFDLPTAAAFHTIRATESVIRKYYESVVGKPPKMKMRNWGTYIRNLNNSALTDRKITGFLDHIRDTYRNPVLHPDETLTSEEAQVLLGVCTSAIIMMINAISKIENDKVLEEIAAEHPVEDAEGG